MPIQPTALFAAAMLAAGALPLPGQRAGQPAAAQSRAAAPTLIRNATVLTVTRGTLTGTDLLIQDGRIAAIGRNLAEPAGARVIDATGKYVMPGIVDAHSHAMSDAVNEGSLSVTSMTRIADILNPTAVNLPRILAGGVTTLHILHGSANAIGGQNAVVKLKVGRPLSEMLVADAPPGIKFALGENPKRANRPFSPGDARRYPATRMGVEIVIRDAFTRAREYQREWAAYRAGAARGERRLIPPRRDLELEPLVEILEGHRWVHAHCYRSDEILMLIGLAEEFGFRIRTFQHVLEGYKVAAEIAAHGAAASTFADNWGFKIEAYDAIPHNAAVMVRHGINVSLNSDSDERARRMNIEAAKMMRYGGLTEDEALALITINPAWQIGIDRRVGSIEVGKDADLVIWNGHPLSVYSSVETTFIEGEIYFDRERDAVARVALEREREELLRAEQAAAARDTARVGPAARGPARRAQAGGPAAPAGRQAAPTPGAGDPR